MAKKKQEKKQKVKKAIHTVKEGKATQRVASHQMSVPFWRTYWLSSLLLMAISIILYQATFNFGYVLDDKIVITDNQYTQKGIDGIWDILTTESFEGYFGEKKDLVQGNRYRPLSLVTFAIEQGLWGSKPGVSHVINVLLYGLTAILLFRLLLLLFPSGKNRKWWTSLAFGAALLYVVHPLHSEAVANIKGRDEIMAMLFSLLTLFFVVKHYYKPSWLMLSAGISMFFLGLLSKENTITFLAVIPLTLWVSNRATIKQAAIQTVPFFMVTIIYLVIRFNTAGVPEFGKEIPDLMNNPFLGMTTAEKSATISYTFMKYIKLAFIPYPLSHDYYPYAIPKVNWTSIMAILGLLIHLAAGMWALWNIKRRSIAAYAILFYVITFSIVSNVVINVGTFMNERFLYMASLGICIWIAYMLIRWLPNKWTKFTPTMGAAGLFMISAVYGGITMQRVPAWESALSLNQSAVKVSPNSARANSFMATAIFNEYISASNKREIQQLLDEAQRYVDKSISIVPDYGNALTMQVGIASEKYKVNNQVQPLLDVFKEVVRKRPQLGFVTEFLQYLNGRGIHQQELMAFYIEVGNMLIEEKRNYQWALHYMNLGLEIDYNNNQLNQSIANAYQLVGNNQEAQKFLNRIR